MNVDELSRLIEYKIAPEPLIAVQGLANTFAYEDEEELLPDPGGTRDWLIATGLAAPAIEVDEAGREKLVALRTLVRSLIEANLTGEQDVEANAALAGLAAEHPVAVAVGADGRVGLDLSPAASVDALIAQMIGVVLQAQIDDSWKRLKICAADDCRWAFYDSSKNQRGHWCSMEVCGNRVKNRTYRRRQSAPK